MSRTSRVVAGRVLAVVSALLPWGPPSSAQATDESRLEAAFVSKFPGFVDWPTTAWAQDELVLCVAARGPVLRHLRELTHGEYLRGKAITTRVVAPEGNPEGCHVLFVPSEYTTGRDRLLARAAALPVLTVGDDPAFLDRGGIILLHPVGQRLRFTIDAAAAQRAGLRLSAQLLDLAVDVRGRTR